MKLTALTLHTHAPDAAVRFYTQTLGMTHVTTTHINTDKIRQASAYELCCLDDAGKQHGINLVLYHNPDAQPSTYQLTPENAYWKYSLFVSDIQRVQQQLIQQNVAASQPVQFGDIGYLAHTQDYESHAIEFIERTFEQNHQPTAAQANRPLHELPQFGLVTLRTTDPIKSIRFYEQVCDMQLYVRMYVDRGQGFTLYFLTQTGLTPPSTNIDALENREWMYQQPHTFIELQHYWGSEWQDVTLTHPADATGFHSMSFDTELSHDALTMKLHALGIKHELVDSPLTNQPAMKICSADGHVIYIHL